jgi:hypothetical protein
MSKSKLNDYSIRIIGFETANFSALVVPDVGGRAFLGVNEKYRPVTARKLEKLIGSGRGITTKDPLLLKAINLVVAEVTKPIWDQYKIATIPRLFQFMILDTVFHSGPIDEYFEALQRILQRLNVYEGIVDGVLGDKTLAALRAVPVAFRVSVLYEMLNTKSANSQFSDSFTKRFVWRTVGSLPGVSDGVIA